MVGGLAAHTLSSVAGQGGAGELHEEFHRFGAVHAQVEFREEHGVTLAHDAVLHVGNGDKRRWGEEVRAGGFEEECAREQGQQEHAEQHPSRGVFAGSGVRRHRRRLRAIGVSRH